METCNLCGKEEEYDNYVEYSREKFNLCKKHYKAWLKEHKAYIEVHRKIKPLTKEWSKMCQEEERLFKKWFEKLEKGGIK